MRTELYAGEYNHFRAKQAKVYTRAFTRDGDALFKPLNSLGGTDWVTKIRYVWDVDTPVMSGVLDLVRRDRRTGLSISPMMTGSTLNRNLADEFSPVLKMGREIYFDVAVIPRSKVLDSGDWREVFRGYIDDLVMGPGNADTVAAIALEVRDLGSRLLRKQIEVEREYGSDAGVLSETVFQQMLDDNNTGITLYTPVPSGWALKKFKQARGVSVLEAINSIALQGRGRVVRMKYDAANVMRLTYFEPDREAATAMFELRPGEYFDVNEVRLSITDLRNVVIVPFINSATGARDVATAENAASIAEFDRIPMVLPEGVASVIDTIEEAEDMAEAIVADTSEPSAKETSSMICCPFVEIGDMVTMKANGDHYDTDELRAVKAISQSFDEGDGRTDVTLRGKPSALTTGWGGLKGTPGVEKSKPEIAFVNTPVPLYDADGLQRGWILTGAVNVACQSLQIEIDTGFMGIESVLPLGAQITALRYHALTDTAKQFVIELLQDPGQIGVVTLTPRAIHVATADGGGAAGPQYVQTLQRTPFTQLVVQRTPIVTQRLLTFTILPSTAQLHYRLKFGTGRGDRAYEYDYGYGYSYDYPYPYAGSGIFGDWILPTLVRGKFSLLVDLSRGDLTVEYFSVSTTGSAEELKRIIIDEDDDPEFNVDVSEDPANIVNVMLTPDDDIVRWSMWARNGASPKIETEPDDLYLKYHGNVNQRHVQFRADDGDWQIVVRGYDINGFFREIVKLLTVTGVASTRGFLFGLRAFETAVGGSAFLELRWQHNAPIDAEAFKVAIRKSYPSLSGYVFDRLARLDADDTDTEPLIGGWRFPYTPALSSDPGANFKTFKFFVSLYDPSSSLVQTYRLELGVWVAGDGGPGETDLPTETPPTPVGSNAGLAAYSVRMVWSGAIAAYRLRIEWEQSEDEIEWDPVPGRATVSLAEGTEENIQPGLTAPLHVRARIAYETAAGSGPLSGYSNSVRVLRPGEENY